MCQAKRTTPGETHQLQCAELNLLSGRGMKGRKNSLANLYAACRIANLLVWLRNLSAMAGVPFASGNQNLARPTNPA